MRVFSMTQFYDNPMGTDGFVFLEYCELEPQFLAQDFQNLGFTAVAKHCNKNITLYQQGDIWFFLNHEPNSPAQAFAKLHGPSVCAMGFRVQDAQAAFKRAVELGAKPFQGDGLVTVPAIYGIGDSLIYFVDAKGTEIIHGQDFIAIPGVAAKPAGVGLSYLDHVTHNVHRGQLNVWAGFYERLFNFREIRYFDIQGQVTGLKSRAMTSPCGKIRIPINESSDDKSQIEEFLQAFNGEGIQHIALGSIDIYRSVLQLRRQSIKFLDVPDTYYEMIDKRVPWHQENVPALHEHQILLDGTKTPEGGLLLQIFTENMLGPVFFEIIQRKGNEGFGEGNFKALFEAIERDQIRRGVLTV